MAHIHKVGNKQTGIDRPVGDGTLHTHKFEGETITASPYGPTHTHTAKGKQTSKQQPARDFSENKEFVVELEKGKKDE